MKTIKQEELKDVYILGIETSCDETSAAVVKNGRELLSNIINSQISEHEKYGGVVPEIASRMHIEAMTDVVRRALKEAKVKMDDITAIAVTRGPGLVGALLVGVSFAKGLAERYKKPLLGVHHLEGHIAANYITHKELEPPFISLIVSGGHTHLVKVNGYNDFEIIGKTVDDAIGEAYDKIARVVGLGYPGGPKVDKMSKEGKPTYVDQIPFPKVEGLNFSFSGIKTAIINLNHKAEQKGVTLIKEDLCNSFQDVATRVLLDKTLKALEENKTNKIVIAGGVSANSHIRAEFEKLKEKGMEVYYPPLSLCTDNAAMIAAQGYYYYLDGKYAKDTLDAMPNLPIGLK